jgi:hypothetical protein
MKLDLLMTKLQWLYRYFKGGCLRGVIVKNVYHLTWVGVYNPLGDGLRYVATSVLRFEILFFPSGKLFSEGKPDGLNWPGRRRGKAPFLLV